MRLVNRPLAVGVVRRPAGHVARFAVPPAPCLFGVQSDMQIPGMRDVRMADHSGRADIVR